MLLFLSYSYFYTVRPLIKYRVVQGILKGQNL